MSSRFLTDLLATIGLIALEVARPAPSEPALAIPTHNGHTGASFRPPPARAQPATPQAAAR